MGSRRERAAIRAQVAALHRRVHPPEPPVPTVAEQVRIELDRRRRTEEEARREAERRRFDGGPCCWCGVVSSSEIDADTGVTTRAWYDHPRGQECAWCHDWRTDFPTADTEFLDRVAWTLRADGVAALASLRRPSRWTPGLAEQLGVVPWIDSRHPPGERWAHLAPIEQRLRAEEAQGEAAAASRPRMTFNDLAHLPGRPFMTPEQERQLEFDRVNREDRERREREAAKKRRRAARSA